MTSYGPFSTHPDSKEVSMFGSRWVLLVEWAASEMDDRLDYGASVVVQDSIDKHSKRPVWSRIGNLVAYVSDLDKGLHSCVSTQSLTRQVCVVGQQLLSESFKGQLSLCCMNGSISTTKYKTCRSSPST